MKRLKAFVSIMLVIVCFLIPNVSLASNDYCEFTEDGKHDFTFSSTKANRHPHDGYRECQCGKRIYFDESYMEECDKCRRELCDIGIHNYLIEYWYPDGNAYWGYGYCYCGREKYFCSSCQYVGEDTKNKVIDFFGGLYEIRHPHREYDMENGRYYSYDPDEGAILYIDACGLCQLESEYSNAVEQYEISMLTGTDYDFRYDEDYGDWDYYENFEDDIDYDEDENYYEYSYDEYAEYEYEDEDEEFDEWLELVNEILGN